MINMTSQLFFGMCLVHTKMEKSAFSISSGFKSVFQTLNFHDTSVDGRPNRRNKAVFSNSSSIVWKEPWSVKVHCFSHLS